ncbi:hypothetical protein FI667_g5569, partial [Globisporangium splendens]
MAPTWSSKRIALLGLVLLAQQSTCSGLRAADSFDFNALTPAPTTRTPKLTMAPSATATPVPKTTPKKTPKPSTTTAKPAPTTAKPTAKPTPTTAKPAPTTAKPTAKPTPTTAKPVTTTTKKPTATNTASPASRPSAASSSSDDSSLGDIAVPSTSPAPTTAAPAPASPYECSASNSALITNLYEKNNVMQGDCAAVNDYYRFPFEGAPTRDQIINMSKSSACTVLMQALLQLLAVECDFKGVAIRSTAEAIIQLSKEIKEGKTQDLPSETVISKAIEARRSDLLDIPGSTSSSSKAPEASATSDASATAASSSSGWKIVGAEADEADTNQHILMSKDLLIVGTWSDATNESSDGDGKQSGSRHGSKPGNVTVDAASSSSAPVNLVQAINVFAVLLVSWMMML